MLTNPRLTPPMRIAVLMAAAGSHLGGLETAAREFATGLAERGHEGTLITGSGPRTPLLPTVRAENRNYRVITVPMLGQSLKVTQLLARLRGIHPSIVESRSFLACLRLNREAMRALE